MLCILWMHLLWWAENGVGRGKAYLMPPTTRHYNKHNSKRTWTRSALFLFQTQVRPKVFYRYNKSSHTNAQAHTHTRTHDKKSMNMHKIKWLIENINIKHKSAIAEGFKSRQRGNRFQIELKPCDNVRKKNVHNIFMSLTAADISQNPQPKNGWMDSVIIPFSSHVHVRCPATLSPFLL